MKRQPRARVPLERALSKLGLASRTQARELVQEGKVKVHGKIQLDPLFPVTPETAAIEIDQKRAQPARRIVLAFHKPRGTVTTRRDEKARRTVFDALPKEFNSVAGLHCVGRLDQATTGLLLLTNDTRLSSWLTDPQSAIVRVYAVTVRGELTETECQRLEQGLESPVGKLQARKAVLRKASRRESHFEIELDEGKNREIRRLCLAVGHEVTALKRLSFGGIYLESLKPGEARELTETEIEVAFPGHPRSTTLK